MVPHALAQNVGPVGLRDRWISVREDVVGLPDGRGTVYGVVECSECVGILPFLDRDTVLLVGQYRYVAGDFVPGRCRRAASTPGETPAEGRSASWPRRRDTRPGA